MLLNIALASWQPYPIVGMYYTCGHPKALSSLPNTLMPAIEPCLPCLLKMQHFFVFKTEHSTFIYLY